MTLEEAEDIIDKYNYYSDKSCCCHLGNPPCSKCEQCPSDEDYNEASAFIEEYNKEINA